MVSKSLCSCWMSTNKSPIFNSKRQIDFAAQAVADVVKSEKSLREDAESGPLVEKDMVRLLDCSSDNTKHGLDISDCILIYFES